MATLKKQKIRLSVNDCMALNDFKKPYGADLIRSVNDVEQIDDTLTGHTKIRNKRVLVFRSFGDQWSVSAIM